MNNDQENGTNDMTAKKAGQLTIIISLVAAALMLLTSFILGDAPYRETVNYGIIAVWFVPFMHYATKAQAARKAGNKC